MGATVPRSVTIDLCAVIARATSASGDIETKPELLEKARVLDLSWHGMDWLFAIKQHQLNVTTTYRLARERGET